MGCIGFYDDYLKSVKKKKGGLKGRYKLIAQSMLGIFISFLIIQSNVYGEYTLSTFVPFLKNASINFYYPLIYASFVILVVSATSNAVNLTDGLDGLAAGLLAISMTVFGVISYISGRVDFSDYLNIAYIPLASELTIFAAAFFGGCLGFLWFNAKPALIFMGDVGSLSSGAALGTLAILLKKEVLLIIVGGVFVIETLSVILQVVYHRWTKKKYGTPKKLFLMAPIHHHFELKGWPESRVVVRFWLIGILFALLSLTTFKIR
jgi:phospho-N-acetylmuramoyl-pentapeptide-transferase